MLSRVVEAARAVMETERGTVFLYDRDRHELFATVGTGLNETEIRFPADSGIAGRCAMTMKVVNVADAYSHEGFYRDIDLRMGYRTRCILSIPLIGLESELVGVLQLINKHGGSFDGEDERIAGVLGAQCAVALQRARLLEEYVLKCRMEHDLKLAREIQRAMLPQKMPAIEGYDLAGWNEPADHTGGDMFDAVTMDDGSVLLVLADASGHGIGPALSVTQFRAMVRMASRLGSGIMDLQRQTNRQLFEDLSPERFITAFTGLLDPSSSRIFYCSCGQAPLLHFHASTGEVEVLAASAPPLGILPELDLCDPGEVVMERGDIFALISDGIFEQVNTEDEQFGLQRTVRVIRECASLPMTALVESIRSEASLHAGGAPQDDDMTIVLAKRL